MTASDDDLIQKGQDDLIRRGDARRILEEEGFLERSLANLNNLPAVKVTAYSENDVAALVEALRSTLNFIENTEGEMGVILGCGDKARAALAAWKEATK